MMWRTFITPLVLVAFLVSGVFTKLLFLQTVTRHGDRAPLVHFDWDLTPASFWTEGYANLTQLGKRQNYVLGKYLQTLYKEYLTSNPSEVLVNSTDAHRCIASGRSFLASFYYSEPKTAFCGNVDWRHLPVHFSPLKKDKFLSLQTDCPLNYKEIENMYVTPEYIQLSNNFKPLIASIAQHVGHPIGRIEWELIEDALIVNKKYGKPLPLWANKFYDQILEYVETIRYYVWTKPQIMRFNAGPMLEKLIEEMKKKISGKTPLVKLQSHFVQSHFLFTLMSSLGVFNNLFTPYCATLVFELHEDSNGSNTVRLLYLNSTVPENGYQLPYVLTMEGCSEYCPLEYFENYTKKYVPQDWDKECGMKVEISL